MKTLRVLIAAALCAAIVQSAIAQRKKNPTYDDPKRVDQDYVFQGEYAGQLTIDGTAQKIGVQVVALGDGSFSSVGYFGGLPGAGWTGDQKYRGEGRREGDVLRLMGDQATAVVRDGMMEVSDLDGRSLGKLKRVVRKSPTLGKKPPEGAIVLFDGESADAFRKGRMTEDGLLMEGITSKQLFGSCLLHVEFRLPYQPFDRGQARGNSGLYLQGRYEVQMLDSFGLEGKNNECGGIYQVKAPDVNMCLPPLQWQTYDIDYTAAEYDGDKVVSPAKMTVRHNGVVIHKNVKLPTDKQTTGGPVKPGPEPGPVYLQDHRNPVRYRNIWIVEKD